VAARRAYTDAEVEAAVQALAEPGRLEQAQRVVAANAPTLQRIFNLALEEAEWFGPAEQSGVRQAGAVEDPEARLSAIRTLLAEETRVSMLIGVAVGYELAHELMDTDKEDS
jgi:hypothetical protein